MQFQLVDYPTFKSSKIELSCYKIQYVLLCYSSTVLVEIGSSYAG